MSAGKQTHCTPKHHCRPKHQAKDVKKKQLIAPQHEQAMLVAMILKTTIALTEERPDMQKKYAEIKGKEFGKHLPEKKKLVLLIIIVGHASFQIAACEDFAHVLLVILKDFHI
ncbi:hypothetical protein QVD17_27418 [Tagetes erecta]|uniref:Uncharacterized protein n=1 Tax=Tagetes erecta TaxID=13708 RepID=A0AAD8NJG6_TARER|nr:hypothetical protein QVD17_27418 [Tagetes erecta]